MELCEKREERVPYCRETGNKCSHMNSLVVEVALRQEEVELTRAARVVTCHLLDCKTSATVVVLRVAYDYNSCPIKPSFSSSETLIIVEDEFGTMVGLSAAFACRIRGDFIITTTTTRRMLVDVLLPVSRQ